MTSRDEAGVSWDQPFNAEGRMQAVTDSGNGDSWGFIYNGDGTRVRQNNPDGTTTLFLAGGSYEVTIDAQGNETSIRKYYAIGGQRVMREDDSNYYLLTDHLGSVVGIADGSGSLVSEQRFLPYGVPRLEPGIDETDFGFTGQRDLDPVGMIDCNARWYDPEISRWSQADPLPIDLPGRQQIVERYSYVSGSPIMYADPTGLRTCDLVTPDGKCYTHNADETLAEYGIRTTGISDDDAKWRIADAAVAIASKLSDATHGHGVEAFKYAMGDVTIEIGTFPGKGNCSTTGGNITCKSAPDLVNTVHELGHVFDVRYRELSGGAFFASDYVSRDWEGSTSGYACMNESCLAHPKSLGDHDLKEEFADMFMNYVLAGRSIRGVRYGFSLDSVGSSRLEWMQGGPAYPSYGLGNFLGQMGFVR